MRKSYPPADWRPAHPNNYTAGVTRPTKIIIHVVQGRWGLALNWFENPAAGVAAHFTVATTGRVGQSLGELAAGYHAGNWIYNKSSFGIEHAGFVDDPSWFTDEMYHSSARLCAFLCKKWNIPVDRAHIIAHSQVPGTTHTDPGPHWDWPRYMKLVRMYRYPKAPSPAEPDTVWRVIAGAFSDRSGAISRSEEVKAAGFGVPWIYQYGQYFRVQVSSWSDQRDADAVVEALKAKSFEAYALAEKKDPKA